MNREAGAGRYVAIVLLLALCGCSHRTPSPVDREAADAFCAAAGRNARARFAPLYPGDSYLIQCVATP